MNRCPFGLRYRSLVAFVPAFACGSCSLREAAPGFRPGSRPPFLYRQERRQRSDPCRLGPCYARAALRCSVFAARAELATFALLTALKQPREVSSRSVLRTPLQSPALLSSSEGGDEHQFASLRIGARARLRHHARCEARWDRESCEATTVLLLGPVGGVEEHRGLGPRAQARFVL